MNPALDAVLAHISRMESDLAQLRLDVAKLGSDVPFKLELYPDYNGLIPGANVMLKAAAASADCFDCTIHDLLSPGRQSANVSDARFLAWLLLERHTQIHKKHMAEYFGNRTESMVRYGLIRMRSWTNSYRTYQTVYERAERVFLADLKGKESHAA